jgi:hypothetical protein
MNKKAFVYFHQGWTDVIMCLGLIDHYASMYDELWVFIRSDSKELLDYYVQGKPNIKVLSVDTDNGRFYGSIGVSNDVLEVTYDRNLDNPPYSQIRIPSDFDLRFHGAHDMMRVDGYRGAMSPQNGGKLNGMHFSEMFYAAYDIPFSKRITDFTLNRNHEVENEIYKNFVETFGTKYIVYHDDRMNHVRGEHHVDTEITFPHRRTDCVYVNLNGISPIIFDYLKVIENAEEIHLIDSIWGCACYQMDGRYGFLQGKTVHLYAMRGHSALFTKPLDLENWKVI